MIEPHIASSSHLEPHSAIVLFGGDPSLLHNRRKEID